MKNFIRSWACGIAQMLSVEQNTFYAFITAILAECSYLFAFRNFEETLPIVIILMGYIVNFFVFAFLIDYSIGKRSEKKFVFLYKAGFVLLFLIGCCFNFKFALITTAIALAIPAISMLIAQSVDFLWVPIFGILETVFIFGIFSIYVIFFVKIPWMPQQLKFVIPVIYFSCFPFISSLEGELATGRNLFELAFEV